MQPLLTVADVSAVLGITCQRVYDLAEQRDPLRALTAIRIGRALRFHPDDIDEFVTRCRGTMTLDVTA